MLTHLRRSLSVLGVLFCTLALVAPVGVSAQELLNEDGGTYRARVAEVLSSEVREIPGTGTEHRYQTIRAEFLEGPEAGREVVIENDYLELDAGDRFYASRTLFPDGSVAYGVIGVDRLQSLYVLLGIFVAAVLLFGGRQGLRSLAALAGGFVVIAYVLMPGLLAGWPPLPASFLVATAILAVAIFLTHGANRESLAAFLGTVLAVLATGVFAILAVSFTQLSGFAAEEAVYLNFNTQGTLDFTGLLLGAIVIGTLGVLDDVAVTQAAVVGELFSARPGMGRLEAYRRALRVGREHVGALVNTLVLAYTGASLPLLLLFYTASAEPTSILNMEIVATEVVRAVVGSLGLILAVPLTTGLAVWLLHGRPRTGGHSGHTHAH